VTVNPGAEDEVRAPSLHLGRLLHGQALDHSCHGAVVIPRQLRPQAPIPFLPLPFRLVVPGLTYLRRHHDHGTRLGRGPTPCNLTIRAPLSE
jgi:hypothetical protein